MTTIQVDDETATALASNAEARGMSIEQYVRSLVLPAGDARKRPLTKMWGMFAHLGNEYAATMEEVYRERQRQPWRTP